MSSDSDVPLARLRKPAKAATKPRSRSPRPAKSGGKKPRKGGGGAEETFFGTLRGFLLQEFLKRWWYVVEWPSAAAKDKVPEDGFERIAGFPGVHMCVNKEDVENFGEVVDHRDHSNSPCFHNYYEKPSAEIKDLVLEAMTKQLAQLLEREPGNERYIAKLKKERKAVEAVNPAKADAEARGAVKRYQTCPPEERCGGV